MLGQIPLVLVIPAVFPRNKWIDLFPTESRSWRAESQLQTGHLEGVETSKVSEMEKVPKFQWL